jgi:hypothetical protein
LNLHHDSAQPWAISSFRSPYDAAHHVPFGANLAREFASRGQRRMFTGKLIFAQGLDRLPQHSVRRCVGGFYIMGRGYPDFVRLCGFTLVGAFFVIRAKSS